jgi:hypothetical protein
MKLNRTLIRPVVTYAAETCTLNISDENALRIFERKVMMKIYGHVCEGSVWRVRSNSESNSLLQGEDVVRHAKSLRLSWLGHVERMESERTPKCLLNGELFEVRRRGRPRKRWPQDVKDDLTRRMRIGKWKEKAANCEGSQSPPRAVELRKRNKTTMPRLGLGPHTDSSAMGTGGCSQGREAGLASSTEVKNVWRFASTP